MVRTVPQHLHFVGVGGVGMSAIARVLALHGHDVTGSDCAESRLIKHLRDAGIGIFIGHAAENVGDAEVVLVSTAIRDDNPEVVEARRRGIPIWHRAQALACLIDSTDGIAIAGTHGKTTTTGMAAVALDGAGLDPTVLVGGVLPEYGGTAKVGKGPHVVAESDESDGSLVNYHPMWAIVTNIDLDHMDHYRDEAHLVETFETFLSQVRPGGGAVVWHDDARIARIRDGVKCPLWTYSATDPTADYRLLEQQATERGSRFRVLGPEGEMLCEVDLSVPGEHNALNATAVVALCHRLGCDLDKVSEALSRFPGVSRRFQRIGEVNGVTVVDDYAHHPTEIAATLSAARSLRREGRIIAAFQPHRYTRTQALWREFAEALAEVPDVLILTDIYSAGETPIEGVSTQRIFDALPSVPHQERALCPSVQDVVDHLCASVRHGDMVLTLGAGNIWQAGEALLERLTREPAAT